MTAKDFQEPLLQALRALTLNQPSVPVAAQDTYPSILAAMGLADVNVLGTDPSTGTPLVVRLIQNACKNLRNAGMVELEGRGRWMLTPEGVTPTAPIPVLDPAPLTKAPRSPYLDDAYILQLVLDQTPCLGLYTTNPGAICAGCPLTAECRDVQYQAFARIAQQFQIDETPVPTPAPGSTAPVAPVPPKILKVSPKLSDRIIAFEEIICEECGKPIRKGNTAIWVEDVAKGQTKMYHPECVEIAK